MTTRRPLYNNILLGVMKNSKLTNKKCFTIGINSHKKSDVFVSYQTKLSKLRVNFKISSYTQSIESPLSWLVFILSLLSSSLIKLSGSFHSKNVLTCSTWLLNPLMLCLYQIETSQLVWLANWLTGFYMIELKHASLTKIFFYIIAVLGSAYWI